MDIEQKIKNNISLKDFTSFRIGGKAKYFFQANSKEEIIEAIKWAQQKKLPFFILAGGSNVLVGDKKFKGLVIKIQDSRFKIQEESLEVGAGVALGKIVGVALQNSLAGMEWAMGIPGTLGGAVCGNAGAFEGAMSDVIEEVEVLNIENFKFQILNFKTSECEFRYRGSIFKNNKNLIILSAKIKLKTGNKEEIEKSTNNYFKIKKQTQPLEFFCAGSIFKNGPDYKAAQLIEKAGLKGKRAGGAEISKKHANFIVSNGRAKAKDVRKLVELAKKEVAKKFNITLEEEIQYLNF